MRVETSVEIKGCGGDCGCRAGERREAHRVDLRGELVAEGGLLLHVTAGAVARGDHRRAPLHTRSTHRQQRHHPHQAVQRRGVSGKAVEEEEQLTATFVATYSASSRRSSSERKYISLDWQTANSPEHPDAMYHSAQRAGNSE